MPDINRRSPDRSEILAETQAGIRLLEAEALMRFVNLRNRTKIPGALRQALAAAALEIASAGVSYDSSSRGDSESERILNEIKTEIGRFETEALRLVNQSPTYPTMMAALKAIAEAAKSLRGALPQLPIDDCPEGTSHDGTCLCVGDPLRGVFQFR